MALTIPNTFSAGQKIEGVKIQENVDAIKKYLDGGVAVGDIKTSKWVDIRHIMKGIYFSTDNSYEMVSGVHKGPPMNEMPVYNLGYGGKFIGQDPAGPVPGAGISFYLEEEADVIVKYSLSPRGIPLLGGVDGAAVEVRLDGVVNNYSQQRISKEDDISVSTGAGADMVGFYRRRLYTVDTIFPTIAKGYHHLQLYNRGALRCVSMKFMSFSIQALYRP